MEVNDAPDAAENVSLEIPGSDDYRRTDENSAERRMSSFRYFIHKWGIGIMSVESLIVQCAHCGAKNRVPKNRVGDRAICGKCRRALSLDHHYPDHAVNITDSTFGKEVLGFPGSSVVFVWSPSCGYCQRMLPIMDQLSSQYAGKVKFAKVNVDENPKTPAAYGIRSIPTLILFKEGKVVEQVVGALPKGQLENIVKKAL